MKGFREWLKMNETGTSTADVSGFARNVFAGPVTRMYPEPVTIGEDPFFRKRKRKPHRAKHRP